jgi:hypothetical protein
MHSRTQVVVVVNNNNNNNNNNKPWFSIPTPCVFHNVKHFL